MFCLSDELINLLFLFLLQLFVLCLCLMAVEQGCTEVMCDALCRLPLPAGTALQLWEQWLARGSFSSFSLCAA